MVLTRDCDVQVFYEGGAYWNTDTNMHLHVVVIAQKCGTKDVINKRTTMKTTSRTILGNMKIMTTAITMLADIKQINNNNLP